MSASRSLSLRRRGDYRRNHSPSSASTRIAVVVDATRRSDHAERAEKVHRQRENCGGTCTRGDVDRITRPSLFPKARNSK